MSKIKLFPLNHEALEKNVTYESSTHFNEALQNIVEKDINLLNRKLESINADITKILALTGTLKEGKVEYDISQIDDYIAFLETKIGDIIIEKGNIKIGLFTSNKKIKRERVLTLENSINTLHKYQDDLLSLKKEYDKIVERKDNIDGTSFEQKTKSEEQNPLERTINFYMKKQESVN